MNNNLKCLLSLIVIPFISIASERYETVNLPSRPSTNSLFAASFSSSVQIRLLDVPTIYELRDEELVSEHVDLKKYDNDVFLSKLLPKQIVANLDIDTNKNPFVLFDTQDIKVADLNTLKIDIDQILVGKGDVNGLNVNEFKVDEVKVIVNQSVYDYLQQLHDISQFDQSYTKYGYQYAAYLKDLDSLPQYLRWQWVQNLTQHKDSTIRFIKLTRQYKILAEVRYEKDFDVDVFEDNLEKAKNLGYDSILVRFDTTEPVEEMIKIVDIIKDNGFDVFLVYVGLDNQKPRWNPFCQIWKLEEMVSVLAPKTKGMMLNWRSTSSHVKLLPKEFFNYLCNLYRQYNDAALIFGEVFFGRIDYLNEVKVVVTCPENVSGIIISNMGYVGYNHTYIANKLFKDNVPNYGKIHKIGQVIGYAPYYATKENLNLTSEKEYSYKKEVEESFRNVNCSTITLLHDGIDDNYVIEKMYNITDNILTDKNFNN